MTKECWQMKVEKPTPCFVLAGSKPCTTEGCPVTIRIEEIRLHGVGVEPTHLNLLLHSECRISSLSRDNQEFKQRVPNRSLQ